MNKEILAKTVAKLLKDQGLTLRTATKEQREKAKVQALAIMSKRTNLLQQEAHSQG